MVFTCRLLFKVTFTLSVFVTLSHAGQTCLSCRGVALPSNCTNVTVCREAEECFMEETSDYAGKIVFNLGCRSSYSCKGNILSPFGKKKRRNEAEVFDGNFDFNYVKDSYTTIGQHADKSRRMTTLCQQCCNDTEICNGGNLCGTNNRHCEDKSTDCQNQKALESICSTKLAAQFCLKSCKMCPSPPVIVNITQTPAVARIGDTVRLTCYTQGYPKPTIDWAVLTSGHIDANINLQKEEIIIQNFQLSNDIPFACEARNDYGQDRLTTRLTVMTTTTTHVQGTPAVIINITQTPAVAHIGDTVRLTCFTKGYPKPTIDWAVQTLGQINSNIHLNGNVVTIQSFQSTNDKRFACHATNKYGEDRQSATLSVMTTTPTTTTGATGSAPVILGIIQSPPVAHITDTVHLKCNAKGVPTPTISWDTLTVPGIKHDISVSRNGDLVFGNISADMNIKFRCHATNKFGSDSLISHLNVHVPPTTTIMPESPAKITTFSTTPTRIYYGDTVRMHCAATGHPSPHISASYLSSGNSVPPNLKYITQGLWEITNFQPRNDGHYRCKANNKAGQDSKEIILQGVSAG